MPKKLIKRYMPDHDKIRNHRHLKLFGTLLHDPNLFHLNRRSVSGAFGVGLFMAFVPVPFQMVLAAAAAIPLRVNLPISVGLVWITNPVTMPPMFYFAYKVGTWVLHIPNREFSFEMSYAWLGSELTTIWAPFLLGCFVCGSIAALAGYSLMRGFWRWHVLAHWEKRKKARTAKKLRSR